LSLIIRRIMHVFFLLVISQLRNAGGNRVNSTPLLFLADVLASVQCPRPGKCQMMNLNGIAEWMITCNHIVHHKSLKFELFTRIYFVFVKKSDGGARTTTMRSLSRGVSCKYRGLARTSDCRHRDENQTDGDLREKAMSMNDEHRIYAERIGSRESSTVVKRGEVYPAWGGYPGTL
jgi:hypothetical protein